jgi:hypothetical protein
MRFQPNRCASIDHKPGPNIARAAPAVPNKSRTHLSSGRISIFQISMRATEVPTIGVHKPAISRIPAAIESNVRMVKFIGAWLVSLEAARTTNAEPMTKRMRSKPTPGHPPANVEYSRRKKAPVNNLGYEVSDPPETPKRVEIVTLLSLAGLWQEAMRMVNFTGR